MHVVVLVCTYVLVCICSSDNVILPVCALRNVCTVHTACGRGSTTSIALYCSWRCSAGTVFASATISRAEMAVVAVAIAVSSSPSIIDIKTQNKDKVLHLNPTTITE